MICYDGFMIVSDLLQSITSSMSRVLKGISFDYNYFF